MARIVNPATPKPPKAPAWTEADEEVIWLALDHNEAVAIRHATGRYRTACTSSTSPSSLNGAGGRVYDVLQEATAGWH